MKKLLLILFFAGFLMSGCIIIEDGKGPPRWAPAHGYRRKHTHTIIITPANKGSYQYHPGRGHGHKKH